MELNRRKLRKVRNSVLSEEVIAEALRKCAGIQTRAATLLGVSQSAISQRVSGSKFLQEIYQEIREGLLDVAEDALIEKLKAGNMTAIIFYLKCIGKTRGYTEKTEVETSQKSGGVLVVPGVAADVDTWLNSPEVKKIQEKNDENRVH